MGFFDGGVSGVAAGIGGYFGQQSANRSNVAAARLTTASNQAEAQRNRNWQQAMSSSAFQRSTKDLRRAGLNPILAMPGGASTGSGAQGQAATPRIESSLGAGITSAMEGMMMSKVSQEKKNLGVSNKVMNAQVKKIAAETGLTKTQDVMAKKGYPKMDLENRIYNTIKKKFLRMNTGPKPRHNPHLNKFRRRLP